MNRIFEYLQISLLVLLVGFLSTLHLRAEIGTLEANRPVPSALAEVYYHFILARLYDASGDFANALSEYEIALRSDPNNTQILAEYAATLADIGRTDDALQTAEKALESDPANVDAHLLLGDIYFRVRLRQDPKARDLAIKEYEAVLKLDSENLSALSSLGRLYVSASQYANAEQVLQKLVNRQPDAAEELFLLALSQAEQRKFDAALENTRRVLQWNPTNTRVLALQGFIYERIRDDDKAIEVYQEILKLQPEDAEAKRRLASLLAGKGRAKDATGILEELAKRNPFDSSVLLELGKAQREQKKYAEAIGSFRSALKTDSDSVEISYWLAATLAETGQREEAITILRKLLERNPDSSGRQRGRFLVLAQIGMIQQDDADFAAAVATFEQLLRQFSEDFRSYLYLANAYRLKKDWAKAADAISKGKIKFPEEHGLVIAESQILSHQRGLEQGLQLLDREIKKISGVKSEQDKTALLQLRLSRAQLFFDHRAFQRAEGDLLQLDVDYANNELVRFQLGAVYEREKKFDKAEVVFKELLERNPDNAGVLNYLGYMWADRGENLQRALQYIQKAVDLDPFNGAYLDSLGWAQFKLNDLKAAEINLNKAAKITRNDPTIHQHLGDLYEKLGNYEQALNAYHLSLSYVSDATDIEKIREKIRKLDKLTKK
ncbi:MAG: tetratricopeptide repeat protein [Acidobacteria bacterium]|nr:tetratricopeptide repeat protein [Acidobacteriota bacterium]